MTASWAVGGAALGRAAAEGGQASRCSNGPTSVWLRSRQPRTHSFLAERQASVEPLLVKG
jgi:hypothetical protein